MRQVFPPEWRTQSRRKRRFYAKYMKGLERAGYVVVCGVIGAFIFAFNYPVDDLITADKVAIQPFSRPIEMKEPYLVVRALANDFDEVRAGQPVIEVVSGADIDRYQAWDLAKNLRQRMGPSAELDQVLAKLAAPAVRTIAAPGDGTFRIDSAQIGKPLDAKVNAARIVDYGDLRLSASLSGQTVAQAKVGQVARVTSINVEPAAGTLFRGTDSVSGRLLGDQVKQVLRKGLSDSEVRLRDDIPLRITDVSEVQVDTSIRAQPGGNAQGAIPLDPPGNVAVEAQVIEGTPAASVQVADLPPNVAEEARKTVAEAVRGKSVRRLDGSIATFDDPKDVRVVVKLKAGPATTRGASVLDGTSLSRTFDATLRIASPPPFLVEAVRSADRNGKPVTARVELRTGRRPIALLLLRKS